MTPTDRLRWFIETLQQGGTRPDDELRDALMPHMHPHLEQIKVALVKRAEQVAGIEVVEIEQRGPWRAIARLRLPDGTRYTAATSIERTPPHRVMTMWSAPYKAPPARDEIVTERLHLRPLRDDDLEDYVAMEADEEVMRWIGLGGAKDRQMATASFEFMVWLGERGLGGFAIVERDTGAFIGRAFLGPLLDEVEIGYCLVKPAWGRGYATEAARALLDWGFEELKLPRIVGITYPDNEPSQRVLRKIGLVQSDDREIIPGQMFRYFSRDAATA